MAKLALLRVLKRKRISKREFARRAGLQYENLPRLFRKGHNPTLESLNRYAKALGVKVRDLLDE